MSDELVPAKPGEKIATLLDSLIDERIAYWQKMTLELLKRVRTLEGKVQPAPISCPSTNGYHKCELEVDHAGDHRGINGKEEWYAWERR